MSKLTVVLATRNEGDNLTRCLESIKDIADEIVVADEESVDNTVQIAKKFGARVISVPHQEIFHITKNIAIDAAKGDWILQLDADEVVSPELAREIKIVTNQSDSDINGYWLNRKNWFLNRFLSKGGQYPDPTLRLYRKGKGRLPAKDVHEQAEVTGKTDHLRSDLLHYRDKSLEKYLSGFNRYSSIIAHQLSQKKVAKNTQTAFIYFLVKPVTVFFSIYLRHRGYVDGLAGLLFAVFSGLIHPVSFLKYYLESDPK